VIRLLLPRPQRRYLFYGFKLLITPSASGRRLCCANLFGFPEAVSVREASQSVARPSIKPQRLEHKGRTMQQGLYLALEAVLTKLRRRPFKIDRRIPFPVLLSLVLRRSIWLLRGVSKTTLLQFRPRIIFVAPNVHFRNSAMCRFGNGLTIERGAIIDGLSEHGIELSEGVTIGAYSLIRSSSAGHLGEGLTVGRNSVCDAFSFFGAGGRITIGSNVMMGQHVAFHAETHNHERTDIPIRTQGVTRKPIVVEDDCWIGANVTFLGGAHVARGSIVGAGAVVNKQYPPFSIIAGVPAVVIRSRLPADAIANKSSEAHNDAE
jgi:acetyltransferase-like isoleucine patch superfamily enzyme